MTEPRSIPQVLLTPEELFRDAERVSAILARMRTLEGEFYTLRQELHDLLGSAQRETVSGEVAPTETVSAGTLPTETISGGARGVQDTMSEGGPSPTNGEAAPPSSPRSRKADPPLQERIRRALRKQPLTGPEIVRCLFRDASSADERLVAEEIGTLASHGHVRRAVGKPGREGPRWKLV